MESELYVDCLVSGRRLGCNHRWGTIQDSRQQENPSLLAPPDHFGPGGYIIFRMLDALGVDFFDGIDMK